MHDSEMASSIIVCFQILKQVIRFERMGVQVIPHRDVGKTLTSRRTVGASATIRLQELRQLLTITCCSKRGK
jgi:hypothetical protein